MEESAIQYKSTNPATVLVSIIIATYNAAAQLPACLHSIRRLASPHIEIVLVDGGSTDQTMQLIKEFDYPRLVYKSEPDQGIYDAFNKGTKMASGKWFHFLGSDDLLLDGFLEIMQALQSANTLYYGNSEAYYLGETAPDYILLGGEFTPYRLAKYPVNHQAVLYPRAVFDEFQYDLNYKIFADYALNLRLWKHTVFRVQYVPVYLVKYNMTGFSSTLKDLAFKRDKPSMIKQYLGSWVYWRYSWKKYRKKLAGQPDW